MQSLSLNSCLFKISSISVCQFRQQVYLKLCQCVFNTLKVQVRNLLDCEIQLLYLCMKSACFKIL